MGRVRPAALVYRLVHLVGGDVGDFWHLLHGTIFSGDHGGIVHMESRVCVSTWIHPVIKQVFNAGMWMEVRYPYAGTNHS